MSNQGEHRKLIGIAGQPLSYVFPDIPIETERLRLRRPYVSDEDLLREVLCDPYMMRFLGEPIAADTILPRLQVWITRWDQGTSLCGIIELKNSGERVGTASIHTCMVPGYQGFEIAYMVLPRFQRQGFALEISHAMVQYAFEEMDIPRLIIDASPENEISNALARRLGFACVGVHKYAHQSLVGHNTHQVWVLERSAWQPKRL